MKKLIQKSSIISMILLSCLLFLLTHGVQIFSDWREGVVYDAYGEMMDQGAYEVADVLMMSQDTDEARYNQGYAWFWSGVDAIGSSEGFLDRIRVMSGGVYMVDELDQLDDGNDMVIQSRERAVAYFSGSTYSGASHNAEVIRTLLGVADKSDEESETSEETSDESEESEDQGDESQDGESQESDDQGEGDEGDDEQQQDEGDAQQGEQEGEGEGSQQQPQLQESVKEQLEEYAEQLQEQQAQNQQFFNKQPQDTQPSQDLFEALFGQPQFRQQIGGGGEKDW